MSTQQGPAEETAVGRKGEAADLETGITRDRKTIEEKVLAIFREQFPFADIGPSDDFFALGGDSLMAISLMSAIEKAFTSIIPISVLLEAATPADLTEHIINDLNFVPATNLVTVKAEGAGPPLFFLHGIDGEALFCRRIAPLLKPARPVYGLRATGLGDKEVPSPGVEAIADEYLDAMRVIRPKGPYVLVGQCGTAVIALELVRRVQAEGDKVSALILMDPSATEFIPWLVTSGMRLSILQAKATEKGRRIREQANNTRHLSGAERREMVREALGASVGAYVPQQIDVKAMMLTSTPRAKKLTNMVRGYPVVVPGIEVHNIEGEHRELFMEIFRGRKGKLEESAGYINEFLARTVPVTPEE